MDQFKKKSLDYHSSGSAGKIGIFVTKKIENVDDLSLAYSPGVAAPCMEIFEDPSKIYDYTAKSNLVAVITNGTAVLGLGNIGALASKPVMEGKSVLFKKFAGIDAFDLEIDETDPDKLVEIISALHPTFGGINLEDIKAPECFYIERKLKEKLSIPVFHDDQHGTAIVVAAGLINALKLSNKSISEIKIVCSGAGAAAIACLSMLIAIGAKKENIFVFDSQGLLTYDRKLNVEKSLWAQKSDLNTISDVIAGADFFLGLSVPGQLTQDDVQRMSTSPIIFALANPEPELRPELIYQIAPNAIVATGRSDYPNQINNALCFPYLFRAALDCRATEINHEMKMACIYGLADFASSTEGFDQKNIIPKLLDAGLLSTIAPAVANAAFVSGASNSHLEKNEYIRRLNRLVDLQTVS